MAVSVWPLRQGLPMVSVMTTPTLTPRRVASALPQLPGRAVGVVRQQHHGARRGVGAVHPGGGQHQSVPGLDDPGLAAPGHHPDRLGVDRRLPVAP